MFSRNKNEPEAAPAPMPVAPPKQRDRGVPRAQVPSIISGDLTVRGTLVSAGDVQIDGRVEGDVRAGALVIGEKAFIEGDVYAEDAVVRGTVHGAIRARKVQLCTTCHVEGNILHEALAMEAGAFFEGNCRHSDNPLAENPMDSQAAPRRVATPMAQPAAQPMRANGTDAAAPVAARPGAPAASFTPLKA